MGRGTVCGILMFLLLCGAEAPLQAAGPRAGAIPIDADGRMAPSPADRCPVCAMLPARYPKFAAAIQMQDGSTYYFCSAGCMISAWLHPEVYLNAPPAALGRPVAAGYFSGRHADARTLFWVAGSDVVGPMGPAVVPLDTPEEVEAFRRRHGGGAAFLLESLTDAAWKRLRSGGGSDP